jgi:hypothetical protein
MVNLFDAWRAFSIFKRVSVYIASSNGIKRIVTAVLVTVIGILASFPQTAQYVGTIQDIAGILGLTAVAQATIVGTLDKKKLAGLVSLLTALIAVAAFVPQLAPYVPIMQKLLAFLAAAGVVTAVRK